MEYSAPCAVGGRPQGDVPTNGMFIQKYDAHPPNPTMFVGAGKTVLEFISQSTFDAKGNLLA